MRLKHSLLFWKNKNFQLQKGIHTNFKVKHKTLYIVLILFFWNVTSIQGQQTICLGALKNYNVDTNENSGNGTLGSRYTWSVLEASFLGVITNSSTSGNKIQIDWKTTPAGSYSLIVKETDQQGCIAEKKLKVTVVNTIAVHLENQYACLDANNKWVNNVVFNTHLDENQYTFKWYKNGILLPNTQSFLTVTQEDTYKVIVKDNLTNCTDESQASVIEASKIQLNATVNDDFQDTQQIVVQATGGLPPYSYRIDGGNYQLSTTFTVNKDGVYEVSVKDSTDCNETSIEVYVLKYQKYFTPNGDGFNDTWSIQFPPNITSFKTSIFDRYGKLIHQLNSKQDVWDGTYIGNNLPSTDYWFVTDYMDRNNNKRQFKSHFSLKR